MNFREEPTGKFSSLCPEDTHNFGRSLGHFIIENPDVPSLIFLIGQLGAGKTLLTGGLAEGLGLPADIHSPCFPILNTYNNGGRTLYHLDLYRLVEFEELFDIGILEIFEEKTPCVIEWADRFQELNQWGHWEIEISPIDEHTRLIRWHLKVDGKQ